MDYDFCTREKQARQQSTCFKKKLTAQRWSHRLIDWTMNHEPWTKNLKKNLRQADRQPLFKHDDFKSYAAYGLYHACNFQVTVEMKVGQAYN